MTLVRRTLHITERATTAVAVIFSVIALIMWANAVLLWGDAEAFANGLLWTFLSVGAFALSIGVEKVQNWGE